MLSFLKWVWEILLHTSFFHPHSHSHLLLLLQGRPAAAAPRYHGAADEDVEECAVCLSGIEEGDEVPELTCRHAFHQVCLERWSEFRRPTCPLCRRSLTAGAPEVLVFDFARLVCSDDDTRRHTWWLR
ncbi:unnamed protein product [Linum tenue]|uniref:RING-type domain-containing protein n=1 Tax=Linum tenue TaxID=586396 RepID=A0AAV0NKJ9_9ROSI|nr:unnamed protein product [Linum tenue]